MAEEKLKWTTEQEAAMERSGNNILVSAAAGSGKTTILVERVIKKLTDKESPADLDRFLIMTFTKAAAAQMKEKIFNAIKKALAADPSNAHLKQQLMKVHTAHISTIDSLCQDIVRENFEAVDVDPGFKIADEAELKMLKNDVLDEVLEEHYKDPDEDFLRLVDHYTNKNDSNIKDIVMTLYQYSESHPAPIAWLNESIYTYACAKDLFADYDPLDERSNWMTYFKRMIDMELSNLIRFAEKGLKVAEHPCGPYGLIEQFEESIDLLNIIRDESFDNKVSLLNEMVEKWPKSEAGDSDDMDADIRKKGVDIRYDLKMKVKKLRDDHFFQDYSAMCKDMAELEPVATALVRLTEEFAERLDEKKREKNIAGFSDVEMMTLKILVKYTSQDTVERDEYGNVVYTETADRLADLYDEIIVDEYQDTNMCQEYIIRALSSERKGKPNVFMVGDVKQSIYGFRMACPELFVEKYDRYKTTGCGGELIILGENFRSKPHILDVTNEVFKKIMSRDIGDIEYNNGHQLKDGGVNEKDTDVSLKTEITIIGGTKDKAEYVEAYEVVKRIEAIVSGKKYKYSDIAILARDNSNAVLENMLSERGIPVIKTSKKGFFDSFEIRLVLDVLAITDNPLQDIPLAAVLHSPLVGVDAEGLAKLKLAAPHEGASLFECLQADGSYGFLEEKLSEWKKHSQYMGLEEFLEYILDDSGLSTMISAMPGGQSRKANLDYLKERARSFSNGPYSGLFNFIRYIKEIKDADIDYGQAQVVSQQANAVQMMTMHNSKGLEFPVVFLVNTGKQFNTNDIKGDILLDKDLGIGLDWRDTEEREKRATLIRDVIKHKKNMELLAEEMRLLYVAMTRAKDKLVIVGREQFLDSKLNDWNDDFDEDGEFPLYKVMKARSFIHFIGMTLSNVKKGFFVMEAKPAEEVATERAKAKEEGLSKQKEIISMIRDGADINSMRKRLEYVYPFGKATMIQAKISPSKLEENVEKETDPEEFQFTKKTFSDGLERGNAYHRFLEIYDHQSEESIEAQLERMQSTGLLLKDAAKYIEVEKIKAFLESNIGQRMKAAASSGKLYRERQFLYGTLTDINHEQTLTGMEATSDEPDEEMLLVQGIIDAFFEEEGKLVLVDYKTDRNVDEETLKERYKAQQDAYAEALQKIYDKEVSEKILYSIELEQEIRL